MHREGRGSATVDNGGAHRPTTTDAAVLSGPQWGSTGRLPNLSARRILPNQVNFNAFYVCYLLRDRSDVQNVVQGDHSACAKPPVDFKTKVPLWPGLPWPGQAKVELLS